MLLIDNYMLQMQDSRVMEPSVGSKWISNIVLVCRKNGSLHYCIDY